MTKISLNLDKSKKYVIACSFGPDSMALLDASIKEKLNVVVAHVNYRKRDAVVVEQKSLEEYCAVRKIKFYILDLLGEKHEGNFQDWARKKRYKFFKQVADQERADSVRNRTIFCARLVTDRWEELLHIRVLSQLEVARLKRTGL